MLNAALTVTNPLQDQEISEMIFFQNLNLKIVLISLFLK